MASTLEDSGELWSLENELFDVVFDVQRWRSSTGVAMATGKLQSSSLVQGLNSALKEQPGDFGKQQLMLWQLRLCSQHHGEGRQASVNGVDSGRLWQTLQAGERTFRHRLRRPTMEDSGRAVHGAVLQLSLAE